MDQTWSHLLATAIGAVAGFSGALLTALLQQRSEHRRWLREQTKLAYSSALTALSRATIVPISTNLHEIKEWCDCLTEVRESLVVLEVYCSAGRGSLIDQSRTLFAVIDQNEYALLATTATTLKDKEADISGVVLLGVGRIRLNIFTVLETVSNSARLDLKLLVVA